MQSPMKKETQYVPMIDDPDAESWESETFANSLQAANTQCRQQAERMTQSGSVLVESLGTQLVSGKLYKCQSKARCQVMTNQLTVNTQYQLQMRPSVGQFLVYIDLSMIQSRTKADTLALLVQLGYEPQLRYLETQTGEIQLYALLRDEQHDPSFPIADDYLLIDRIALFELFPGEETAIYSLRGLPKPQTIAA
jgi:hypothetical protein